MRRGTWMSECIACAVQAVWDRGAGGRGGGAADGQQGGGAGKHGHRVHEGHVARRQAGPAPAGGPASRCCWPACKSRAQPACQLFTQTACQFRTQTACQLFRTQAAFEYCLLLPLAALAVAWGPKIFLPPCAHLALCLQAVWLQLTSQQRTFALDMVE